MTVEPSIHNILSKKQIKELEEYFQAQKKSGFKPTDTATTKGLKAITKKWKEELLEKGIDSDYLAYVLSYIYSKTGTLHVKRSIASIIYGC